MDKDISNSIFLVNCPVCGSDNISTFQDTTEIPQYGKIMLITVKCNDCSYKFNEIFDLEGKPPRRYILKCEDMKDLSARIIKSSNSTIHIPDLEIDINPGPASEGYITNVEGVLQRVKTVLKILGDSSESKEESIKIQARLEYLDALIQGKYPFTIIIEDPTGNCCIISERNLSIEELTQEEIENLDKGDLFSIDIEELKKKDE